MADVETPLFSVETADLGTTNTLSQISTIQPAFVIGATDYLVVKYFAKSDRGSGAYRTCSLTYNGTTVYSYIKSPLSLGHSGLGQLAYAVAGHTGFAPIDSPSFTGTPVLPTGTTGTTQAVGTNSTTIATTAFVLANISSAWSSFSPTPIWGTANPTITTTVARFATTGKTTTFNVSFVISNGNDASSLTMSLPVAAPQIATYYYALKAFKQITTGGDSIRSDPFAYIDYTLATPIIKFYQFGTLPAGYTAILNISGSYEVA